MHNKKKVIIENNVFDNLAMAAVYLSNDCNDWYESGAVRDMIIRGNTFYIKHTPDKKGKNKGAIYLDPIVKSFKQGAAGIHKNIVIENNKFYMEHDNILFARGCENIVFKNNTAEKLESNESEKVIKAFKFQNCKNISIENNKFGSGVDSSV